MTVATTGRFGTLLRQYRRAAGLTQEELAGRAGLSTRAVGSLERGDRRAPYTDTVQRLAAALALPPDHRERLLAAARAGRTLAGVKAGPEPVLVDRYTELEALERCLDGAAPPVVFIAGEPGIGKTRLLQEARSRGQALGFTVLRGGCRRHGEAQPYAPLIEALSRSIESLPHRRLARRLFGCEWLVLLLPEIGAVIDAPSGASHLPPEQARRLLVAAMVRYFENIAGAAGILALLDDLQWADPDTLELLVDLLRAAEGTSLRLIGAYRTSEVESSGPLAAFEMDLVRAGRARQLALGGLAAPDARRLLDALVADAVDVHDEAALTRWTEQAMRVADGVPFYLVRCAADAHAHGLLEAGRLPWDVAQSVRARFVALPPGARAVLAVAAVAGRVMSRWLLLGASGLDEEASLAGIEAACAAQLLEETEGGSYRFVHDVIREVVEAEIGAARRMVLHRRVAEALEARPDRSGRAGELARHWLAADAPQRALPWIVQAGDRAREMFAWIEAERQYRLAMELASEMGDRSREAEASQRLAEVLLRVGRFEDALSPAERALTLCRAVGDPEREARAATSVAHILGGWGRFEDGVRFLQTVLPRLEGRASEAALAPLYAQLMPHLRLSGRYADCVAAADRSLTLAQRLEDPAQASELLRYCADALAIAGRRDEATELLGRALVLAELSQDLVAEAVALAWHKDALSRRGDWNRLITELRRAVELAERMQSPDMLAGVLAALGWYLTVLGEWAEADVVLRRVLEIAGPQNSLNARYGHLYLGYFHICTWDWEQAREHLEMAVAMRSNGVRRADYVGRADSFLALLDLREGHPERALSRAQPLLDRLPAPYEDAGNVELLPIAAEAHLAVSTSPDALDAAQRVADEVLATVLARGSRIELPDAYRVCGMALARRGRWDEAERVFDDAVASGRDLPYARALALYEQGLARLARVAQGEAGDGAGPREPLATALDVFRWLGAKKEVERVERALIT